jgi:hypothetical protein
VGSTARQQLKDADQIDLDDAPPFFGRVCREREVRA